MKLTKIKIEELVQEIIDWLQKNELDSDVCIYFNNKRIFLGNDWDREKQIFIPYKKVEENINPLDYFEYANPKHILSMSFEGALYHVLNGYYDDAYELEEKFHDILEKYGLYYELGHAWNLTCYPNSMDFNEVEYEDIEYTSYEKEPNPIIIYSHSEDVPMELLLIKHMWDKLSATTQHLGGSCVIGDGFEFKYKENKYIMVSPSYLGSLIYERWIDTIKNELSMIGATGIHYNYGHLD